MSLFILLSFLGCKSDLESYFHQKTYHIDSIIEIASNKEMKSCFTGRFFNFKKEGIVYLPDYDSFISKGGFTIDETKQTIHFSNFENCIFNVFLEYEVLSGGRIIKLQEKRYTVFLKLVDFREGDIKIDIFKHAIDSTTLNSKQCMEFRKQVCSGAQ